MVALVLGHPAATASTPIDVEQVTTPRPSPANHQRARQAKWPPGKQAQHTGLEIDPAERGSEDERNHASAFESAEDQSRNEPQPVNDGEAGRLRSELARDLIRRVDELLPLVGTVSMATHIGLFKRDLSKCHGALKDCASQSNYLSIVTLVESALAQLKWKDYTTQKLEAVKQALEMGYHQVSVGFDDYQRARDLFSKGGVEAAPLIDLESLDWQDITDAEEET